MTRVALGESFEDDRGLIQDLLTEKIDSITRIFTRQGAVRGNHVHNRTKQWTYVLTGNLYVTNGKSHVYLGPGELVVHEAGEPHAWKATQDTDCLVFTRGPRSGAGFEDDTFRLEEPLIP
jgi:quercetin dioxygenase-like cupin family protein